MLQLPPQAAPEDGKIRAIIRNTQSFPEETNAVCDSTRPCRCCPMLSKIAVPAPHMISIWELLDGVYVVGKPVRSGDVETPSQLPTVVGPSNLKGRSCAKSKGNISFVFSSKSFQFTDSSYPYFCGGISSPHTCCRNGSVRGIQNTRILSI